MHKKSGNDNKAGKTINILIGKLDIKVQLNETKTSKKLLEILPISSNVNRWGDEIYFSIPLKADIEDGIEEVNVGTVAFWPPGNALCIFFGKTPASQGNKPQAASPVTIIGNILNIEITGELREVRNGEKIYCRK
ncbi:MAG: cyclophilin-like fold protein [Candidatus Humimicrobiaceae bacterium]